MIPWLLLLTVTRLLSVGATIVLLVNAFRVSPKWGFVTLLVPFGSIVFVCKHWREGGAWFVASMLCSVASVIILLTHVELFAPQLQRFPELLALLRSSPAIASMNPAPPPTPPPAARVATDIAGIDSQAAQRDGMLAGQDAYAKHAAALGAEYKKLDVERAKLKGGGPALAAFNVKAAKYQENLRLLEVERTQLGAVEQRLAVSSAATHAAAQSVAGIAAGTGSGANNGKDAPATREAMDAAAQRVRTIINQVPPSVVKPPGAQTWTYGFHPGATKPDLDRTDLVSGRELWDHDLHLDDRSARRVLPWGGLRV